MAKSKTPSFRSLPQQLNAALFQATNIYPTQTQIQSNLGQSITTAGTQYVPISTATVGVLGWSPLYESVKKIRTRKLYDYLKENLSPLDKS